MTHVLVVGAGSVGRRHARNLAGLGADVSVVDPRPDRRAEAAGEVTVRSDHADLDAALAAGGYDAAVIASPTALHVPQALATLGAGLPTLVEKPLAATLADGTRLAAAAGAVGAPPVLLGYTWRWWPALRHLRDRVRAGDVGEVRHLRCVLSAHLADWHPWERYQDFFMARADLGGGALLDESHWIDLAIWLLGEPADVTADVATISDLEIDTDDNVDLLLRWPSGTRASLHLDVHGRPHERSVTVAGSTGTLRWSDAPDAVAHGTGAETWDVRHFDGERNDMFTAVAAELIDVAAGRTAPSCTVADGLAALRVVEAARRSSAEGRRVGLAEVGA
ncbi:MAG: Gfo/Idh/MocA family protein [Nitriliruptoraceae bacterium]